MNILIVEDEALAARRLKRMVEELLPGPATSVAVQGSLAEAEHYLAQNPVNLVFLDLNLNGESGFDLLKRLTAGAFHTIIVSASTDQAVTAFDYGVLDFVPKPFDRERLKKALDRLGAARSLHPSGLKYLSVKSLGAVRLVPLASVRFFKGADDYVEIHCAGGSVELYGKSLDSLMQLLPPHYCRTHKSYIADLKGAKRILVHGGGKYELELQDGIVIPVSRTQYQIILDKINK
ncbi:MAG TPA: LytTR family DNA-binding domain-containing protein [Chitinivibrionales bacterium]|nr:LytTR family DNA-binding domain-containing protein [Chitinivibrionales bacterium]